MKKSDLEEMVEGFGLSEKDSKTFSDLIKKMHVEQESINFIGEMADIADLSGADLIAVLQYWYSPKSSNLKEPENTNYWL